MQIIPVAIIIVIIWIRILLTEMPVWQHVSDHINRQLNSTINFRLCLRMLTTSMSPNKLNTI